MNKATDVLFRVGLIFKGVDSVFEMIGGILLTMPLKLARYILVLSQHEAFRHHLNLAGKLDNLAQVVEVKTSMGEAIYLFSHGLGKVVFIAAIVCGKKWGYTGLIVVLSVFTLIELTRSITAHEIVTGLFGVFDLVLVVLIYKEYKTRFPRHEVGAPHELPT